MKISDQRLRISDSLKISDFSNSLGVLQHPQAPPSNTPDHHSTIPNFSSDFDDSHDTTGTPDRSWGRGASSLG